MTTVLAIESMLESGSSIHETALKAGAARALVEAAFAAVVGQGPKPMICLHCYGDGTHGRRPVQELPRLRHPHGGDMIGRRRWSRRAKGWASRVRFRAVLRLDPDWVFRALPPVVWSRPLPRRG